MSSSVLVPFNMNRAVRTPPTEVDYVTNTDQQPRMTPWSTYVKHKASGPNLVHHLISCGPSEVYIHVEVLNKTVLYHANFTGMVRFRGQILHVYNIGVNQHLNIVFIFGQFSD